tara:strand:- start:299 stop:532 length:234 start_codon:yes stop_codon:yes gene_type:complete
MPNRVVPVVWEIATRRRFVRLARPATLNATFASLEPTMIVVMLAALVVKFVTWTQEIVLCEVGRLALIILIASRAYV